MISILTVAIGLVGELDVIEREFLSLTNHTHHKWVTCLQGCQRPVHVLGVKLHIHKDAAITRGPLDIRQTTSVLFICVTLKFSFDLHIIKMYLHHS